MRVSENDLNQTYWIYLHDIFTLVGEISYRGYHNDGFFADVGYSIYKEYQGNGYAYEALELLGDYLNKNGIDDIWITVIDGNIPSIKTIERYGGVLLGSYPPTNDVLKYECKTRKNSLKKMNKNLKMV